MEYTKTTFGEWCKTDDAKGRVMVFCKHCNAIVIAPRELKSLDIKTCPKCNLPLEKFDKFK